MKKYNFVYLTTNLINGKQYLGKHSTDNLEDGYVGSGTVIKRAIKKYRKENFKREILEFCDTEQKAFDREYEIGLALDILSEDFYNLSLGGRGGFEKEPWNKGKVGVMPEVWNKGTKGVVIGYWTGKKRSAETINKLREGLLEYYKENDVWNKGKSWSKEVREKHYNVMKDYYKIHDVWNKGKSLNYDVWNKGKKLHYDVWNKGKVGVMPTPWNKGTKGVVKAWNKGIPMSEESKKKCSLNSAHCKGVVKFDLDGNYIEEYRSQAETNINGIGIYLKGINHHAGGFLWLRKEDYEKNPELILEKVEAYKNRWSKMSRGKGGKSPSSKKVIQLHPETKEEINIFGSITEAKQATGKGNIGRACRTDTRANGYYWKYKE